MIHHKIGGFVIALCIFSLTAPAQDVNTVDLGALLRELEVRFAVSFTYADENIRGLRVSNFGEEVPLDKVLGELSNQTGLIFRRLNDRFIAIVRAESSAPFSCGIVLDSLTGNPIEGVTVMSGKAFTVTDISGSFRLQVENGDTLTFRTVQYQSVQIPAPSGDCIEVRMKSAIITLNEVIITDVITTGIDQTAAGTVVMDTKRLGILPGLIEPDVLQAVQALPGIQSITEKISDINIRGGTNDQNFVSWNGIKMYQTGHFFGLISAFNPYLTEKVTFIRNGSHPRFGEAVSGSLLIESGDEVSRQWNGSAGINMIYGDMWTRIPVAPGLSLQLSGRRSVTDVINTPTYEQYFDRIFSNTEVAEATRTGDAAQDSEENFYFYDLSAKVLYDPSEKDRIRLSMLHIYNDISYDETGRIAGRTEEKTSELSQRTTGGGLSWARDWSSSLSTEFDATWSSYDLTSVNQDIQNDQRLIQENSVLDYFTHAGVRYKPGRQSQFSAGYQFRETGITNFEEINNPVFSRFVKEVIRAHSAYASFLYKSADQTFQAEGGFRANYFGKLEEWTVEPRFSLHKSLPFNLSVLVQGEMKSQATTQVIDFQRDFLGVEKRRWLLANGGDVPLITSHQLSAGISYQPGTLLISADVYMKQVEGITTSSQGFVNQFGRVREAGNYQSRGLDLLVRRKFISSLSSWLSYSYMENEYEFSTLVPPEFPSNLDIRHTVSAGVSYQGEKIEASVGFNWHSGIPFTSAEGVDNSGLVILYGPPNGDRLNDYIRLDLSTRYNFKLSGGVNAQVGAAIWNLTDSANQLAAFYRLTPEGQPGRVNEYALGLTPNLLFRVSF